jgi:uncharacterized membrane protein YccC
VRDRLVLFALATLLAGVSAAVLQLNYALFAFFLTPTFVLLAEMDLRDWRLATVRIVDTLLGGALALAGARILWPLSERKRFPDAMASGIAALAAYLAVALRALLGEGGPSVTALAPARRRLGLAINAADASFERLLAERTAPLDAQEAGMTLLLYARRASDTLGAAAAREALQPASDPAALEALAEHTAALLADLEAALREGRAPAPLPPLDDPVSRVRSSLLGPRLVRFVHQVRVLHQAGARWARAVPSAGSPDPSRANNPSGS